jgi:hypothetical protein
VEVDAKDLPAVLYQGYSIHGNEPSGGNAAVLVAYYLAAGQSPEIEALLESTVILFDPCYNPDGFNRFATWANIHRNKHLTADPEDREYDEVWPGGRTNHYWFDLNRDWLPVQHPESRGRIRTFHQWKPNILTDHHEMGTNATFFFMPGEPSRVHPLTPWRNQELTEKIGDFHAEALDQIGSLYYSQEGYDDYYYGKGSTYPDVNGCIGILFEQASSRGHLQESDNGLLSFAFTIRNQVATSLSTHRAAFALHDEILAYQRQFYQNAAAEARAEARFGYVFGEDADPSRANALIHILQQHQIAVHPLAQRVEQDGYTYEPGTAYVVPLRQNQYRFIKGIFDPITTFTDSLFYDISTWTLPMAFNLPYATLSKAVQVGDALQGVPTPAASLPAKSNYAYLLPWADSQAPRLAYQLQAAGLRLKVATERFTLAGEDYGAGTVFLPVENQAMDAEAIHALVTDLVRSTGVPVVGVPTGLSSAGPDLGSRQYSTLQKPSVAVLVGEGITSYEAGSNWFWLDQQLGIPLTKLPVERLAAADLSRYTTIIMPNGRYGGISNAAADKLRNWVSMGGTLIAQKGAARWCAGQQLAKLEFVEPAADKSVQRPYAKASQDRGARVLGGAIFATEVDLTNPLLYGFQRTDMPSFRRGNLNFKLAENPYASPIRYTEKPLLSGYVHASSLEALKGTAALTVSGRGRGQTICMADEPAFRAFWYGTARLLANAVFFGSTIDRNTKERL